MRFSARHPEAARQQRREQWRRDRNAAQTLRDAFPSVELVRMTLSFEQSTPPTPTSQSHVMHPPARAFFGFACPYADCDGQFDLNAAVTALLQESKRHVEGTLECAGVRSRDKLSKQPCRLVLRYTIAAQYHAANER
jgi:hypothetical protein